MSTDLTCHTISVDIEAVEDSFDGVDVSPNYTGELTAGSIAEGEAIRLPHLAGPTMLHVISPKEGLELQIDRIIECPIGCTSDEIKYCVYNDCCPSYLLPAGKYDINICKQLAYPLEIGETSTVDFILEPVGKDFVDILGPTFTRRC